MKGYRENGRLVLTEADFLELAAELRKQVQMELITLPYYPKTGMVITDEECGERRTD